MVFYSNKLIILFVSVFAFLWGVDSEEKENLKTPEKKPTTVFCGPTPGEVVSKLQSEVLKKDRFISVFGEATVESWGFDWNALESPEISFAEPSRISAMSRLHKTLTTTSRSRNDENFRSLYVNFLELRERITIVHTVRLETIADTYFHGVFPGSIVDHDTKDGGVQLGTKAKVTLATGEERIYHIKTHSDGRLSEKSSAPKRINPQELLAYKILEYTGFGCESHFLQRSSEDVYIATLNAGYGGSFDMFVKATGRLGTGDNEVYGQTLWGLLQNIHKDPRQNDWNAVRELIQEDATAQNFLVQMVSLDMMTRILRLHDLLNNTENFGFFKTGEEKPALKVIDFRITDGENFYVNFEHFGGFLEGNGLYNYVGSHRTMRYVLHDRPRAERVETALHILTQGPLMQLHQQAERAYRDVCAYITNTDVFADHLAELMEKLNTFHDAIHRNIDFFLQRLQSWEPEIT